MKRMGKGLTGLLMVLCFLMIGSLALQAAKVPDHYDGFYVNDYVGVISDDTEAYIININQQLFDATGAQIVFTVVDMTQGRDLQDYAVDMFNAWGIGSAEKNNGLLIVLATVEEDYACIPGAGLDKLISSGDLRKIFSDNMDTDFDAGNYDAGVRKTFDALITKFGKVYNINLAYNAGYVAANTAGEGTSAQNSAQNNYEPYTDNYARQSYQSSGSSSISFMFGMVLFIIFCMILLSASSRRRYRMGGGYYRPRTFWLWPRHHHHHHGHHMHGPGGPGWGGGYSGPKPPPNNNGNGFGGMFGGGPNHGGGGKTTGGGFTRSSSPFRGTGGSPFGGFGGGGHFGGSNRGGGGMSRGGGFTRKK